MVSLIPFIVGAFCILFGDYVMILSFGAFGNIFGGFVIIVSA